MTAPKTAVRPGLPAQIAGRSAEVAAPSISSRWWPGVLLQPGGVPGGGGGVAGVAGRAARREAVAGERRGDRPHAGPAPGQPGAGAEGAGGDGARRVRPGGRLRDRSPHAGPAHPGDGAGRDAQRRGRAAAPAGRAVLPGEPGMDLPLAGGRARRGQLLRRDRRAHGLRSAPRPEEPPRQRRQRGRRSLRRCSTPIRWIGWRWCTSPEASAEARLLLRHARAPGAGRRVRPARSASSIAVGPVPVVLERDDEFPPFAELSGEMEGGGHGDGLLGSSARSAPAPAAPSRSRSGHREQGKGVGEGTGGGGSARRAQARVARMLTDPEEPPPETTKPFGEDAIRRSRQVLRSKRVDDALPLLQRLAPHREALRPAGGGVRSGGRPGRRRWRASPTRCGSPAAAAGDHRRGLGSGAGWSCSSCGAASSGRRRMVASAFASPPSWGASGSRAGAWCGSSRARGAALPLGSTRPGGNS